MSSRPSDDSVSTTPPMDPKEMRRKLSLMAWLRVGFGALAGVLAGFLNFLSLDLTPTSGQPNPNAYYGFYIAVLVYVLTYYVAKYSVLKGIPAKDKNKLITQGIGSFIMMFLFIWILYNTGCYLNPACPHI